MKYICEVVRGGRMEALIVERIESVNESEVLVHPVDKGRKRLRISGVKTRFTFAGLTILGVENTPNGWETATVRIVGTIP